MEYEIVLEKFPDCDIPPFLLDMIIRIEEEGINEKGIFRIPGLTSLVDELIRKIDKTESYDIKDYAIEVVASTLKQYFRELPDPLFTYENSISLFENHNIENIIECLTNIKNTYPKRFNLIWRVLEALKKVSSNSKENLMDDRNISMFLDQHYLDMKMKKYSSKLALLFKK